MMADQPYWEIEGGARLRGEIHVRGGKNSAPKDIVASLLTSEPCTLTNVPRIGDVAWTLDVCRCLGSEVEWLDATTLRIHTPEMRSSELPAIYGGSSRLPVLLLGPLLARLGHARVPHGGGCQIGSRPVAYHLNGLARLGAVVEVHDGHVEAHADRLQGAIFELPYPSVGATETLILAAVMASGTTVLRGIAVEPEILDFISLLHKMGARIRFEADRTISIRGLERLHGFTHRVVPDRNECASWACAAIATGGNVNVIGADQRDLLALLGCLREIGGNYEVLNGGIRFFRSGGPLMGISVDTNFHPGFMSDWQPPLAVLLSQAHGQSLIHETVYEDRFRYVSDLVDMGADISLHAECLGSGPCRFTGHDYRHSCVINGPTRLRAGELDMPDLRGGFAHVMAAMVADGTSRLSGVDHIARGYEDFIGKSLALGVAIRVHEPAAVTTAPPDSDRVGVA
jgi:UDP-N-acetylglucosamine 1-carboxyvinyltransferase